MTPLDTRANGWPNGLLSGGDDGGLHSTSGRLSLPTRPMVLGGELPVSKSSSSSCSARPDISVIYILGGAATPRVIRLVVRCMVESWRHGLGEGCE
jgi:hypothetical protein